LSDSDLFFSINISIVFEPNPQLCYQELKSVALEKHDWDSTLVFFSRKLTKHKIFRLIYGFVFIDDDDRGSRGGGFGRGGSRGGRGSDGPSRGGFRGGRGDDGNISINR
jgi:hypothetical protein